MIKRLSLLPVGAEPNITGTKPLYNCVNPPDRMNPCSLCKRVLRVSIGKSATSTKVPAKPPD
jgi:hypothetical protein